MQELVCEQELVKQEIEVVEKKKLRDILTAAQILEFKNGKIVAQNAIGEKLRLDEIVKGTITILSPLQGG